VVQSSGEEQLQEVVGDNTIVVATLGSEPLGRYAAILILDAESAYSQVDLRSQEEVRLQWFKLISQLTEGGILYLSLPAQSTIAQGILKSDPYELARRETEERYSAKLPPYYRTLLIEAPFADLQSIGHLLRERGIEANLIEGSLKKSSKLFVKFAVSEGQDCAALISSVQRIRASKKQNYLGLKFDSYSIT
jgi:primosomal protein N' (replication factor Y)